MWASLWRRIKPCYYKLKVNNKISGISLLSLSYILWYFIEIHVRQVLVCFIDVYMEVLILEEFIQSQIQIT